MAEPDLSDSRLAPGERAGLAPPVPPGTPPGPGILVVDDDGSVRRLLGTALRRQGFAVWLTAGGLEALGVYRCHGAAIDVVLLDVCMPGLDGPQTLAALRRLNPRVRCCFMSGDFGSYTERGLRDLGAAGVFDKPFRLTEVAEILRGLAGEPGP